MRTAPPSWKSQRDFDLWCYARSKAGYPPEGISRLAGVSVPVVLGAIRRVQGGRYSDEGGERGRN